MHEDTINGYYDGGKKEITYYLGNFIPAEVNRVKSQPNQTPR